MVATEIVGLDSRNLGLDGEKTFHVRGTMASTEMRQPEEANQRDFPQHSTT